MTTRQAIIALVAFALFLTANTTCYVVKLNHDRAMQSEACARLAS